MQSFLTRNDATLYLFPGQGSQTVGMGRELADRYAVARSTYQEADETLGFALSTLCFDGPEAALTDTVNTQPALLATSIAVLRVLEEEFGDSAPPDGAQDANFLAGHSLGEYSALVAAGSVSFADGLRLVRERGRLMKEAGESNPGLMAAVLGLDEEIVATICAEASSHGLAQVANDNCPGQVVISGDAAGMEAAMKALSAAGARKVVALAVSIAAHSPLMAPAADALAAAIDATPISPPLIPIIANTSAQPITTVAEIRHELTSQLTGSVRWTDTMRYAFGHGVKRCVEIGAGDVLTGMVKRVDRSVARQAVSSPEDVGKLRAAYTA